jgi:hypothetical protein
LHGVIVELWSVEIVFSLDFFVDGVCFCLGGSSTGIPFVFGGGGGGGTASNEDKVEEEGGGEEKDAVLDESSSTSSSTSSSGGGGVGVA